MTPLGRTWQQKDFVHTKKSKGHSNEKSFEMLPHSEELVNFPANLRM